MVPHNTHGNVTYDEGRDSPTVSSTRSVFFRSECLEPDVTSVARISEAKERERRVQMQDEYNE